MVISKTRQRIMVLASTVAILLLSGLVFASTALAYSWTFDLIPPSGDLYGLPGETLTWDYTIVNQEGSLWLDLWSLGAGLWQYGSPFDLFDYPTLAPGDILTGSLYQFTWDIDAPIGFVNSGLFTLSGDWYDDDPYYGSPNLDIYPIGEDKTAPYSATVVPEPNSLLLLGTGLFGLLSLIRRKR